jgi:hypothetical protein
MTDEETDALDDDEDELPQVLTLQTVEDDCGCMKSGEGGIRTPGTREGTPVFKTGDTDEKPLSDKELTKSKNSVCQMVALDANSESEDAPPQALIDDWPSLPDNLKRAIESMVEPYVEDASETK